MPKENKLEKRMYLLDLVKSDSEIESIAQEFKQMGLKEGMNIHVDISREKLSASFPEDYDAYFIHFSSIADYEQIARLKKQQPWCKVFVLNSAISSLGEVREYPEAWEAIDKLMCNPSLWDYKDMVKMLKDETYRQS